MEEACVECKVVLLCREKEGYVLNCGRCHKNVFQIWIHEPGKLPGAVAEIAPPTCPRASARIYEDPRGEVKYRKCVRCELEAQTQLMPFSMSAQVKEKGE